MYHSEYSNSDCLQYKYYYICKPLESPTIEISHKNYQAHVF